MPNHTVSKGARLLVLLAGAALPLAATAQSGGKKISLADMIVLAGLTFWPPPSVPVRSRKLVSPE